MPGRLAESLPGTVIRRYRALDLEYSALKVVGRGLFLAVMLTLVLLFAFAQVTDLIVGQNEVLIPTTTVDPTVDLGAIVRGAFTRTSGSVFSVIGILTLIVSSYMTARALRTGTRRALLGPSAVAPSWTDPGNIGVAIGVPVLVLATWLLTLATTIRRAAWSQVFGTQLSDAAVNTGKAGCVLLQVLLLSGAAVLAYRAVTRSWPGLKATGILLLLGILIVAGNFFFLYTYVGALINPRVSAGIVLIVTLLLWVNVMVRAYLGALCWISERSSERR